MTNNFNAFKAQVGPVVKADPEVNSVRVQLGEQLEDRFGLWSGQSLRKSIDGSKRIVWLHIGRYLTALLWPTYFPFSAKLAQASLAVE